MTVECPMSTPSGRLNFEKMLLFAALEGISAQRKRIEDRLGELVRQELDTYVAPAPAPKGELRKLSEPKRKRRKFSAETRARMSESQKKRWAKAKAK